MHMVEISGVNINLHLSTLSPLMSLIFLISLASLTSHISHLSNLSHPLIPRILSPTTQYPSPLLSLSPFPSHPSYPLTPLQAHPAARLPVQLYIQYKKDSKHAYVLSRPRPPHAAAATPGWQLRGGSRTEPTRTRSLGSPRPTRPYISEASTYGRRRELLLECMIF